MNKKLIVANWKMNLTTHEASVLVHRLSTAIKIHNDVAVVLAPSLLHIQPLVHEIDHRKFHLAAQNAYHKDTGAFTGEVSFAMLRHLVQYAIVGHSERRIHFNESLEVIRDKVTAAIRNEITPILCVGETHIERKDGETKQVLHDQLVTALSNLTSEDIEKVVIAYEPVWAISTFGGELAKPDDVHAAVEYIRLQIAELYGKSAAEAATVLYGGSVDDQIVRGYMEIPGVDGALVGSASLSHHKFAAIVETAHAVAREQHG
jgi:triosephosphate isomerase (TIM)